MTDRDAHLPTPPVRQGCWRSPAPPAARSNFSPTLLLVLSTLSAPGLAQGTDPRLRQYLSMPLEELMAQTVSIASHSERSLTSAPGVVSVITAEDFKATGATNLVEALQSVPGVYVRYQGFAFRPLVSFRAANNKQALVMVNGAPVSDLSWRLGIFWKGLPVSAIERVEIIRGPGSALFGTDASTGVINVITKTAGKITHNEAGVRAGSFDTRSGWMQYGGEWGAFEVGVTADLSTTDGHDPFVPTDGQTRRDQSFGTTASLAPANVGYGYDNADLRFSLARDKWRLQLDYLRHDDVEDGLTGAAVIDDLTAGRDSRFNIDLLYDDPGHNADWGVKGELRYRHLEYTSGDGFQEWPPGTVNASGLFPDGEINQLRSAEHSVIGEVSGLYRGLADHALTLGSGFRWQDIYKVEQFVNSGVDASGNPLPAGGPLVDISGSPYAFAPEKSRTVYYLYAQDEWDLSDAVTLTLGGRYDHHSDFGGNLAPRLALVWQSTDKLTTKLLYGEAFRAPYFQELFAETSFSLPNPDLRPEASRTWELAFGYAATSDLHLGLNLFHFRQTDVIQLQTVAGQTKRQYQNFDSFDTQGLELEAWWQTAPSLRLSGNYAYNDPDDSGHGERGTPRHQAYLRADWDFLPDWRWNIQGNWIGEAGRLPGDARAPLGAYLLADTTLRYTGPKNWELALSVRNLFDEDARAHTRTAVDGDLPLPGRSLYLEARYDLDGLVK